jgi:hypothetical protein
MTGIQFVTDDKGRKTAVLIDLKKHGAVWEDFWDGLVAESRRKGKGIPYEEYRVRRLKDHRRRGSILPRNKIRCAASRIRVPLGGRKSEQKSGRDESKKR